MHGMWWENRNTASVLCVCGRFSNLKLARREGRHPFLDESFVQHVLQLPLWCVADLRLPPGEGDKLLLRSMLRVLGLPRCAYGV